MQAWESALKGLPLGAARYYQCIGSTNDEALRWASEGAFDMSLVIADEQLAGRGRYGRRWYTPAGSGLAFSMILKYARAYGLRLSVPVQFYTVLGALAVCDALRRRYDLPAQIKWPNDVLVEGRKLTGVLAEASWAGEVLEFIILGIGINVARSSVPPAGLLNFPATSVEECLDRPGVPFDVQEERFGLLREVISRMVSWRRLLGTPEFLGAWEEWLAFKGEWVQVSFLGGREGGQAPTPLEGRLSGLAPDGALQLLTREGTLHSVAMGEIQLRTADITADMAGTD